MRISSFTLSLRFAASLLFAAACAPAPAPPPAPAPVPVTEVPVVDPVAPDVTEAPSPAPTSPDPAAAGAGGAAQAASAGQPDGAACNAGTDCASGSCEGEGCGPNGGVCVANDRICTRDLRSYCGCDGVEFQASGSCPGRRFAKRGGC